MAQAKRLLLIDDSEERRSLFKDFLSSRDFVISEAADGKSGYQAGQENPPDLILLDFHLPDMEGAEVCRMLRENPKTRAIPVIMITAGYKSPSEKVWGFRSGADDYLDSPVRLEELIERIYSVLRRAERKERRAAPAPRSEPLPALDVSLAAVAVIAQPAPSERAAHRQWSALGKEYGRKISGVLLEPAATLRGLKEEDFLPALMVLLSAPLLDSLAVLFRGEGALGAWIASLVLHALAASLAWAVLTGLTFMFLPFVGAEAPWRKVASAVALAWAPQVLGALLSLIYAGTTFLRSPVEAQVFSSGVDLFYGGPPSGVVRVLTRIGLLDAWSAILVAVGLCLVCPIPPAFRKRFGVVMACVGLMFGVFSSY